MTYERDEYMRRQEAEHDMIRMRERPALRPRQQDWKVVAENAQRRLDAMFREQRSMVSAETVARLIEHQEIAPIIKQRLIAEIAALTADKPEAQGLREETARAAAEAWRIPSDRDGIGEMVKPKDDCVWGYEQGFLAALKTRAALQNGGAGDGQ